MTHLPRGWDRIALGKIGRWFGGGTPSKANPAFWADHGIPWVSPKDMKRDVIDDAEDHITSEAVKRSATNMVKPGSVLVVVRSGILRHTLPVAVTSREVALNQDLKAVEPDARVHPRYLALGLKASEREILQTCTKSGTTVQNLDLPVFLRFELNIAPPEQQRDIVNEIEKQFTRLDAGVAALRRVQSNLKRYRASVLKSACEGRLVPTEASLARAESRPFESAAELLQRILAARRTRWSGRGKYDEPVGPETRELPPLPESWTWASAEQICEFITKGTTPVASKLHPDRGDVQFLKVYNLTFSGHLDTLHKPVFVDRHTHEVELARSMVRSGDILINIVGPPLGQMSVVPEHVIEANINQAIARFRVVLAPTKRFVATCLMADRVIRWMLRRAKTTAGQANLTLELCRQLPVPLPPLAEQHRIVAELERRLSVIDSLEAVCTTNLQRASRLRQSILQRAFSGGLTSSP
ncbi:MAG: restriction endonuclease subunit S [Planctomycetes bacterium]|nr:restriction endonuclease subunit S [Planctomycetota bacterium]